MTREDRKMKELFDDSDMGEMAKEKLKAYNAIFSGLDPHKSLILNQMCSLFETASVAYKSIAGIGKYYSEVGGVCEAGACAEQYMKHFEILKELYGNCSTNDLETRIDKTSEYLKNRGWYGIPSQIDKDGVTHIKTAHGMHSDMESFIKAYNDIKKVYAQAKMEEKK